jgi:hypothetical protein
MSPENISADSMLPSSAEGETIAIQRLIRGEIGRRIREGVKASIEQVLKEEMTEHLFPNDKSLANLATVMMLRATEDWAFRRYMDMGLL